MKNNKKRFLLFVSLILVLTAVLSACKTDTSSTDTQNPGISLDITSDTCPNVIVNANQQVTWTNSDTKEHFITDNTPGKTSQFSSGTLKPGDSFSFVFVEAGDYTYQCSNDGSPDGTITVQE